MTTGNMLYQRVIPLAAVIAGGRVLVAGGYDSVSIPNPGHKTAEIFDSVTATYAAAGQQVTLHYYGTATTLSDGRVLLAGGETEGMIGTNAHRQSELYDPVTGTFTATGRLVTGRGRHAAVLTNGKVLIAGGGDNWTNVGNDELYDPATGRFSNVSGFMGVRRRRPTAVTLPNGKVFVSGGYADLSANPPPALTAADIYNPTTNSFTPAAYLFQPRVGIRQPWTSRGPSS